MKFYRFLKVVTREDGYGTYHSPIHLCIAEIESFEATGKADTTLITMRSGGAHEVKGAANDVVNQLEKDLAE